jgi:hypothetical protein
MITRKHYSVTTPTFHHPDWRFYAANAKFNRRAQHCGALSQ